MNQRTDIWTYLIITAVAAVIWYWAAGETRLEQQQIGVQVEFRVGDSAAWQIVPASTYVTLSADGSQRAIRNAEQIDGRLFIDLQSTDATQTVNVAEAIRNHPRIQETGITLVSTSPSTVDVTVDEIVNVPARVVLEPIPEIEVDEVVLDPPQVVVSMPSRLRPLNAGDLTIRAVVASSRVTSLTPGVPHELANVPVGVPERWASNPAVSVEPSTVSITLTIRSQRREIVPPLPVQVQVASPEVPEFLVDVDPKQLRNVTITAPADLISRIESGDAVVVAIVHLKFSEIESGLGSKPVSYFIAMLPDGTGIPVEARVGEAQVRQPVITLTITERQADG